MNNDFVAMTGHVKNGNYNFMFLNDNTACEIDKNGEIKRVGVHKISYLQNEIVNKIYNSVNTNNLEKGEYFEYENYFKFTFMYKTLVEQNKIVDNLINITIPKNILENDTCYTNFYRLGTVCNHLNKIKIINEEKIKNEKNTMKIQKRHNLITASVVAAALLGSSLAFAYGINEGAKAEAQRQQQIIDEINKVREEKDVPPIGLLDETGKQYNSWDEYYKDIKLKQNHQENVENLFDESNDGPIL